MRMLVVDDDPIARGIVVDMLSLLGHAARDASGGAEALALLRTERFDAVLLDHLMPEMTGVEVLEKLRAIGLDIPVGFVTGSRGHPDLDKLLTQAVPIIFKPFGWAELKAFLDTLVGSCRDAPEGLDERPDPVGDGHRRRDDDEIGEDALPDRHTREER